MNDEKFCAMGHLVEKAALVCSRCNGQPVVKNVLIEPPVLSEAPVIPEKLDETVLPEAEKPVESEPVAEEKEAHKKVGKKKKNQE